MRTIVRDETHFCLKVESGCCEGDDGQIEWNLEANTIMVTDSHIAQSGRQYIIEHPGFDGLQP